jgi:hypothetical protein
MALDFCMLSNNITDYYVVSQGKTTIPGVDDGEECELTDVSASRSSQLKINFLRMKIEFCSLILLHICSIRFSIRKN